MTHRWQSSTAIRGMPLTRNEKIVAGVLLTGSAVFGGLLLAANWGFVNVLSNAAARQRQWDTELAVDVDAAMPTADDFPGGWIVADEGVDYVPAKGRVAWRILRLEQPTQVAYVAVTAAHGQGGLTKSGWVGTQTITQAYSEVARIRSEFV